MVVDPNGPPCPCGRRGCWERYASGSGLAQLARTAAVGGRLRRVLQVAGGDVELLRGEHVQAAAEEGDAEALAVIDEFARWVALGLVNLTNAFDPAVFVLGGGLAEGAHLYLAPIQHWFGELLYAPAPAAAPGVVVRRPRRARRRRRRRPAPRPPRRVPSANDSRDVGGSGLDDLTPGVLAAADAGGGGVLVGLERLVDLEEVLDLGHQLRRQVG